MDGFRPAERKMERLGQRLVLIGLENLPDCHIMRGFAESIGIGRVEKGVFGAMMLVKIYNDGPVTIILDSADLT